MIDPSSFGGDVISWAMPNLHGVLTMNHHDLKQEAQLVLYI